MYYLRTKPATNAIQFTIDKAALRAKTTHGTESSATVDWRSYSNVSTTNKDQQISELRQSMDCTVVASSKENGESCTLCSS